MTHTLITIGCMAAPLPLFVAYVLTMFGYYDNQPTSGDEEK